MLEQEVIPPPANLGLASPYFSIQVQKERSIGFKIRQNAYPAGVTPGPRWELMTVPQTL